jgi:hypothetical protein
MLKGARKHASTGGWGFQVWVGGDPSKPQIPDEAHAVTACFGCHTPQKAQDYVFSRFTSECDQAELNGPGESVRVSLVRFCASLVSAFISCHGTLLVFVSLGNRLIKADNGRRAFVVHPSQQMHTQPVTFSRT